MALRERSGSGNLRFLKKMGFDCMLGNPIFKYCLIYSLALRCALKDPHFKSTFHNLRRGEGDDGC